MTPNLLRFTIAASVTVFAFVVALFFPVSRELLLEIVLLVLGALALQALVRAMSSYEPRRTDASLAELARHRRMRPPLPEGLTSIDNRLVLAEASAADFHRHIRPLLRAAAAQRLRVVRRIDVARDPDQARALLGEETWALIRPDAVAERDPRVRGVSAARIGDALDAIEKI